MSVAKVASPRHDGGIHIAPPALSRQARMLEDELGIRPFDRPTPHLARFAARTITAITEDIVQSGVWSADLLRAQLPVSGQAV